METGENSWNRTRRPISWLITERLAGFGRGESQSLNAGSLMPEVVKTLLFVMNNSDHQSERLHATIPRAGERAPLVGNKRTLRYRESEISRKLRVANETRQTRMVDGSMRKHPRNLETS